MDDHAQALDDALARHRAGELDAAEAVYRAVAGDDAAPATEAARAWHLWGVAALHRGDPAAAEKRLGEAVGRDPAQPRYWNNFGVAAQNRGDAAAALERFVRAVTLDPAFPEAAYNKAAALQALGRLDEAEDAYRAALALAPGHAAARNNLGAVLKSLGRPEEAAQAFEAAAETDPRFVEPLVNLGILGKERGLREAAIAAFDRALGVRPSDGLHINRATVLPAIYRDADDLHDTRRALETALDDLLSRDLTVADPLGEIGLAAFYLPYQGFDDRQVQEKFARLYARSCPSLAYTAAHCRASARPRARRLRIGFLSKFFYNHTIGKYTKGLIREIDRTRFDVTVFTLPRADDGVRAEIRAAADAFVELPMALDPARRVIAEAKLDILVFTDIGMDPFTYFLGFSRLAPVQCATWGHPVTSGLAEMDYFLSQADMEPDGAEACYSETLVRLPRFNAYYDFPTLPATLHSRADLGLHPSAPLYVCAQSPFKLHPDFDAVLADILRRDPAGRVVLIGAGPAEWKAALEARFARALPDVAGRIDFIAPLGFERFLSLLRHAAVSLDPTPFCGGNTTLEAFAVGTPVITLPGAFMRGRVTHAFYRQMGIDAGTATSPGDYVARAVALAGDPDARATAAKAIVEARPAVFEDRAALAAVEDFLEAAATGGEGPSAPVY